MDDDVARAYALVYSEAVRAITQQREAFESLRSRAGVLLSGAAIASSLFGQTAVVGGRANLIGVAALLAFLPLGAALVSVLWPRPQWDVAVRPASLVERYIETSDSKPLYFIHRDLADDLSNAWASNQLLYERLSRHFRVAAVLLGIEMLLLLAAVVAVGVDSTP